LLVILRLRFPCEYHPLFPTGQNTTSPSLPRPALVCSSRKANDSCATSKNPSFGQHLAATNKACGKTAFAYVMRDSNQRHPGRFERW
jgi:hypothetical protein